LRNHITIEKFKGSLLIVFANLKRMITVLRCKVYNVFAVLAAKLRGIESFGMVLAASNPEKTIVELIRPPEGSTLGERICLEGEDYR